MLFINIPLKIICSKESELNKKNKIIIINTYNFPKWKIIFLAPLLNKEFKVPESKNISEEKFAFTFKDSKKIHNASSEFSISDLKSVFHQAYSKFREYNIGNTDSKNVNKKDILDVDATLAKNNSGRNLNFEINYLKIAIYSTFFKYNQDIFKKKYPKLESQMNDNLEKVNNVFLESVFNNKLSIEDIIQHYLEFKNQNNANIKYELKLGVIPRENLTFIDNMVEDITKPGSEELIDKMFKFIQSKAQTKIYNVSPLKNKKTILKTSGSVAGITGGALTTGYLLKDDPDDKNSDVRSIEFNDENEQIFKDYLSDEDKEIPNKKNGSGDDGKNNKSNNSDEDSAKIHDITIKDL